MKTTIEISDPLLLQARKLAARQGITLRALVERGLRRVVAEEKPHVEFKLRRASFKGSGLQAHIQGASWERLRDLAYEGRGG
jgi:putative antitoxin of VapBC-like toxin-antitoxin system